MSKLGEASEKLTQLVFLHIRTPWPREGYRASKWGSKNQTKEGIPAPPPPLVPSLPGPELASHVPTFYLQGLPAREKGHSRKFPSPSPWPRPQGYLELPGSDLRASSSGPRGQGSRKVGQRGGAWMGRDMLPQSRPQCLPCLNYTPNRPLSILSPMQLTPSS